MGIQQLDGYTLIAGNGEAHKMRISTTKVYVLFLFLYVTLSHSPYTHFQQYSFRDEALRGFLTGNDFPADFIANYPTHLAHDWRKEADQIWGPSDEETLLQIVNAIKGGK